MSALRQVATITWANLRCIPRRIGASLVIVIGIAGVVGVLLSVLSMVAGFRQTMAASGSPKRVIVLSRGAEYEGASTLSRSNALRIMDAPGIARAADGKVIASAETWTQVRIARRSDGENTFVTLRGLGEKAFELRPEFHLIAGRMFRPGVHEILVGKAALTQFRGLEIGNRLRLREGEWTVVGLFDSQGSSYESGLLTNVETLMSAYRYTELSSVTALLASPEAYTTLNTALHSDPTLTVDLKREPEYFLEVSKPLNRMLTFVTYLIGGVMGIGALAGALNTMYSAVSARAREIATLRAIGFSGAVVVSSIFIEALLLAALGAAIGAAIACALFNGHAISMMGSSDTSQLVYSLQVTPMLIAIAMAAGCSIGFLGGLVPAIQVARRPVAEALRGS